MDSNSGLPLEIGDFLGLAVGLLLRAPEILLGLALALLAAALAVQLLVAGEVARGLLHASCDLVGDAHMVGLPTVSSAVTTSFGAISSRPGSGASPCGSPRRPAHRATWRPLRGGPHSDGGVGP